MTLATNDSLLGTRRLLPCLQCLYRKKGASACLWIKMPLHQDPSANSCSTEHATTQPMQPGQRAYVPGPTSQALSTLKLQCCDRQEAAECSSINKGMGGTITACHLTGLSEACTPGRQQRSTTLQGANKSWLTWKLPKSCSRSCTSSCCPAIWPLLKHSASACSSKHSLDQVTAAGHATQQTQMAGHVGPLGEKMLWNLWRAATRCTWAA